MTILIHSYRFTCFDWFCVWYPPGWLILFNRHWQHYHSNHEGWNWLEYGLFLIPGGFYLALLIRWLRLGCRRPCVQSTEFDPNYQQAFRDEVLAPIIKYYFQGQLQLIENLPKTGPLIVAMNHAGMSFPWDFLGLAYLLSNQQGWIVQPLANIFLFEHPLIIWLLPPGWAQILGGVPAEIDKFEAIVAQKTILIYAPEGLRGPGKNWDCRYQLATFHPSFIALSDRYQIPILPVVCMGNEYLHPFAWNIKRLVKRFPLPFVPISVLMFFFIIFPSMGIWAMKTRLSYYIQPLYKPWLCEESNSQEKNSIGISATYKKAQNLREKLQNKIKELLIGE